MPCLEFWEHTDAICATQNRVYIPHKYFTSGDFVIGGTNSQMIVIPLSLCNVICPPGCHKKKKEGKPFCCYDCVRCAEGKVSPQAGICLIWLATTPPFPDFDMHSVAEEIVLECND
ncbi:hypothetical protein E2320_003015, partial [Naja naja]